MKPWTQVTLEGPSNNPGPAMSMKSYAIILTRPDAALAGFAGDLRDTLGFGGEICLSPLLEIEPVDAGLDLTGLGGLIFTSKNGVERFAVLSERRDLTCWCVGAATAHAAKRAGLNAYAADGDAPTLIRRILADVPKAPLLHIRGEAARGDVAATLTEAGIFTRDVVVYRQARRPLSERAKTLLKRENPVILPLFSPNTARQFVSQGPYDAPLLIAAISENVAAELTGLAVERLVIADKPDAGAMLKAVDALIAAEDRIEGGTDAH